MDRPMGVADPHAMAGKHEQGAVLLALAWFNQIVTERDYGGITRALDRLRPHSRYATRTASLMTRRISSTTPICKNHRPTNVQARGHTRHAGILDRWVERLRGGLKACLAFCNHRLHMAAD